MATTKKCRYCSEEISADAKLCKHCKKDLRLFHQRHPFLIVALLGLIGIFAVSSWAIRYEEQYLSTPDPKLEIISMDVSNDGYGYSHIKGEVKNISTYTLDDVLVIGHFSDASGNIIGSGENYIQYSPLLPGEVSPFDVVAVENPSFVTGGVAFQTSLGTVITMQDGRANK